jgi:hypothetical protein
VLKVQRGESLDRWKLSRRQRKGGLSLIIGVVLGAFAYTRYVAGDIQGAEVIGFLAIVAILLGLRG